MLLLCSLLPVPLQENECSLSCSVTLYAAFAVTLRPVSIPGGLFSELPVRLRATLNRALMTNAVFDLHHRLQDDSGRWATRVGGCDG